MQPIKGSGNLEGKTFRSLVDGVWHEASLHTASVRVGGFGGCDITALSLNVTAVPAHGKRQLAITWYGPATMPRVSCADAVPSGPVVPCTLERNAPLAGFAMEN